MQPKEEWVSRCFLQPCDRVGDAFFGAAVPQANFFLLKSLGGKSIVVKIEPASQTPAAVEHECAHYGSGSVAGLFEGLGYGTWSRLYQHFAPIYESILEWIRVVR